MEFGSEMGVMLIIKEGEKRNNGKNSSTKSRLHLNPRRDGKFYMLEDIRSRHHLTETKIKVFL